MKEAAFALVLVSIILLFVAATACAGTAGNSWSTKAPMHVSKEGVGAAAVDGLVYVVGGRWKLNETDGGFTYISVNATEAYNPATDTWVLRASMPTARDSFGAAAYQKKVYCFGGAIVRERGRPDVTNVNEVYDTGSDTWQTKAAMPTARYGFQASEVGGKIYLVGGWLESETSKSDKVEIYDPLTDNWTAGSPMPQPVAAYASAVLDGKIYVISGLTSGSVRTNLTQVYDPKADKWSLGLPIPMSVSSAAAGATTGAKAAKAIYIVGGSNASYPLNGQYVNQAYFPDTNSWTCAAAMPIDRAGHAAAVVDDSLYVMGGGHNIFTMDSTTIMQYTPFANPVAPAESFSLGLLVAGSIVVVAVFAVAAVIYLKRHLKPTNPITTNRADESS